MSTYPTPTQSPIQPDERGLQLLLKDELSRDLNCHQIGIVQAFYPATQTADININIAEVYNGTLIKYPTLLSVPVIILHGGSGAITFPITKGDICLVLFNDRDMDNWYTSGQTGNAPNTTRTHSLSDGIALVGLFSGKNPLSTYSSTDTQLIGSGPITLSLGSGKAKLANSTTDLLTTLTSLISALTSWHNTDGTTPNPATVTALTNVQTALNNLLKT